MKTFIRYHLDVLVVLGWKVFCGEVGGEATIRDVSGDAGLKLTLTLWLFVILDHFHDLFFLSRKQLRRNKKLPQ